MTTFVRCLDLITVDDVNCTPRSPKGYHLLDCNLKTGTTQGGIFLCYSVTDKPEEAITGVNVFAGPESHVAIQNGYMKLEPAITSGARRTQMCMYICYARVPGQSPVTEVDLIVGNTRHTYPLDPTWIRITQNLSKGTCGKFVYLCYKVAKSLPDSPRTSCF